MLRRLLTIALALSPLTAWGQTIQQYGTVTPGHVPAWLQSGIVQDGGSATAGKVNSLGLYGLGGTPLCITNSATPGPFTGGYTQLCMGGSASELYITDTSYGGATHIPLKFIVNGNVVATASDSGFTGGGGGTPGGTNGQIQYNNSGAFGGFTMSGDGSVNTSTGTLTVSRVNGTTFPSGPSNLTVPVITASNAVTWEKLPTTALSSTQGNGTKFQLSTGTPTNGHCVQFDSNGNTVDAGGPCTTGGGGGTVTSGSTGQMGVYASTGTVISGTANATLSSGALTLGQSGTQGSLVLNGSTSGTQSIVPTAVAGTHTVTIPAVTGTLITSADSGTVTNTMLAHSTTTIGGQSVALGAATTNQGNGSKIQLSTGATTTGDCVEFDANGNTVDAGAACGGGAAGNPGGSNGQLQYNNAGVFGGFTMSGDVTVIPSTGVATVGSVNGVTYTSSPSTNTVPVVTGTNAITYEAVPNSALANPTMTIGGQSVALGGSTTNQGNGSKIQLSTGTTTTNDCAKFDANGNIVDAGSACGAGGGGTVNSGTAGQLTYYGATGTAVSGNANATISSGALTLGQSGTQGSVVLNGSTSGATTIAPTATAGTTTATLPANTGTIAELNLAQTWSAAQTVNSGDLKLAGSSSGTTTLNASATASGTLTLPAVTDTVAVLGTADQTLSGGANFTSYSNSTGSVTVDCGKNPSQYIINGGAYTITAPANDGQCILFVRNNGSAGTTTFSGFTVGSNTGASLTTTSGNLFTIFIWRVTDGTGSTAGYNIFAHQ